MFQDEGHCVHECLIRSGRVNSEHLEYSKERFAMARVVPPDEGLIAVAMMGADLFALL